MGKKSLRRPFLYLTKDLSVAWLCWVGTGFDGAQLLQGGCSPLLTGSCSDRNCSSIFPSSVAPLSGTGHGCRDHLFESLTTLVQIPLLPPVSCGPWENSLGKKPWFPHSYYPRELYRAMNALIHGQCWQRCLAPDTIGN